MKMKEFGPREGARIPLDPPMLTTNNSQQLTICNLSFYLVFFFNL